MGVPVDIDPPYGKEVGKWFAQAAAGPQQKRKALLAATEEAIAAEDDGTDSAAGAVKNSAETEESPTHTPLPRTLSQVTFKSRRGGLVLLKPHGGTRAALAATLKTAFAASTPPSSAAAEKLRAREVAHLTALAAAVHAKIPPGALCVAINGSCCMLQKTTAQHASDTFWEAVVAAAEARRELDDFFAKNESARVEAVTEGEQQLAAAAAAVTSAAAASDAPSSSSFRQPSPPPPGSISLSVRSSPSLSGTLLKLPGAATRARMGGNAAWKRRHFELKGGILRWYLLDSEEGGEEGGEEDDGEGNGRGDGEDEFKVAGTGKRGKKKGKFELARCVMSWVTMKEAATIGLAEAKAAARQAIADKKAKAASLDTALEEGSRGGEQKGLDEGLDAQQTAAALGATIGGAVGHVMGDDAAVMGAAVGAAMGAAIRSGAPVIGGVATVNPLEALDALADAAVGDNAHASLHDEAVAAEDPRVVAARAKAFAHRELAKDRLRASRLARRVEERCEGGNRALFSHRGALLLQCFHSENAAHLASTGGGDEEEGQSGSFKPPKDDEELIIACEQIPGKERDVSCDTLVEWAAALVLATATSEGGGPMLRRLEEEGGAPAWSSAAAAAAALEAAEAARIAAELAEGAALKCELDHADFVRRQEAEAKIAAAAAARAAAAAATAAASAAVHASEAVGAAKAEYERMVAAVQELWSEEHAAPYFYNALLEKTSFVHEEVLYVVLSLSLSLSLFSTCSTLHAHTHTRSPIPTPHGQLPHGRGKGATRGDCLGKGGERGSRCEGSSALHGAAGWVGAGPRRERERGGRA